MALTRSSTLLYGGPGAGKSDIANSAWWDMEAKQPIRKGRWLQFGQEHNESFGIPEEFIRTIASPVERPLEFVTQLRDWLRQAIARAGTNDALEVIVFDGITEWGVIYELGKPEVDKEALKFWGGWKDLFIEIIQMMDYRRLNAHVIATARIDQFSKGIKQSESKGGGYLVEPDPSWLDFKYFPAVSGKWASHNLSHYFQQVFYVDQDVVDDTSGSKVRRKPIHKLYALPLGDFWVKNVWERGWLALHYPEVLTNPKYDDILNCIEGVQAGVPWKGGKA